MSVRAVWNGVVLAESDETVVVEGNHYFPAESLRREYFAKNLMKSLCYWKGIASYYSITVDDITIPHAAWYYAHPSPLARRIKNRVAFGPRIRVEMYDDAGRGGR
ncbi:MAG: DUF427 domain-containing protein [Catenulispora sp.]|nr:DUF427 domain-containing protein [Catenulispora sp.]